MNDNNVTEVEGIDLPSSAYHLGVDEAGRDHYHDPMSARVWAARGDDVVHTTSLGERTIVDWVLFVDEDCGWDDRQDVELGLGTGLLEGVFEREAELREERRFA